MKATSCIGSSAYQDWHRMPPEVLAIVPLYSIPFCVSLHLIKSVRIALRATENNE